VRYVHPPYYASGLVITYVSSGILNFAYAALAYFVARFYYYLHVQQGWGLAIAAIVSIVLAGPALGVMLWAVLFRFLRLASPLIKIVVTVGLSVGVVPITILLFGNQPIVSPPGLAPQPVPVFPVLGTDVTLDQVIVYACTVVILAAGAAVLRWTDAGLLVRAVVDSEAMASLSGIRPAAVAAAVWAVSTFIAGVAGVLAAPIIGLDITSFTVLIAGAFAAVIAARLRRLGTAAAVGLLMGIATSLAERYLPSTSQFTSDVIPSIPFIFIVVFLAHALIRRERYARFSRWEARWTGPSRPREAARRPWPARPAWLPPGDDGRRSGFRSPPSRWSPSCRWSCTDSGPQWSRSGWPTRLLPVLHDHHRGSRDRVAMPDHVRGHRRRRHR
jgi:branched-subunit amino acid ABC-type transport system permease component